MCLIIDANFVHHVHPTPDANGTPIRQALLTGRARLVYGGKLSQEYRDGPGEFRRWLVRLDQAGRARKVPDVDVNQVTEELVRARACVSDDPHIIGLARVSGARLLCSSDVALHTDFTNSLLLSPKGSVYQRAEHRHLVDEHCHGVVPAQRSGKVGRKRGRGRRRLRSR